MISAVGDGVGSGVSVRVGTRFGKKIVGVSVGEGGKGVFVGAGLVLTHADRSSAAMGIATAAIRARVPPPSRVMSRRRMILPLMPV